MTETPRANRIHIAFFGLRNAGKSTLVNAFTGQRLAIVSETPGTTTDPVSKAMEILPLGPCLVTDTAGLDDVGDLGAQRVAKTLEVLATTDVAVWVEAAASAPSAPDSANAPAPSAPDSANAPSPFCGRLGRRIWNEFQAECKRRHVTVLGYHRGESVEALKAKIAALKFREEAPGLLEGLVRPGDHVVCVCPIDEAAPKGRLILPQVQVIRDCLDRHVACTVCQPAELAGVLKAADARLQMTEGQTLVVTDSQAFGEVWEILKASRLMSRVSCLGEDARREIRDASARRETRDARLTSFSILFARQKGDLGAYVEGLAALKRLKDGETVLIAEGCTHHRQCNDIGTVKIPKALAKLSGRKLNFTFASGGDFINAARTRDTRHETRAETKLIVHCGGCMLTRREVLRRIELAREAGIPIVNYGLVLAAANGIEVSPDGSCLAPSASRLASPVSCPGPGEAAK